MKKMNLKWYNPQTENFEYGYAEYRENMIAFSNEQGQTFDRVDIEDVDNEEVLDCIWEDLENMASQEEDGCADVTNFELV